MARLWYSHVSINRYTREEVAWIIVEALDGSWPSQPSGYIDTHEDVDTGGPKGDLLTAADAVVWEIEGRMKRAPKYLVEVLKFELQSPDPPLDLWHYDRFRDFLSPPARRLLNYLSGMKRRRMSFADWCCQQDRRRNEGETPSKIQVLATNLTGNGKIKS